MTKTSKSLIIGVLLAAAHIFAQTPQYLPANGCSTHSGGTLNCATVAVGTNTLKPVGSGAGALLLNGAADGDAGASIVRIKLDATHITGISIYDSTRDPLFHVNTAGLGVLGNIGLPGTQAIPYIAVESNPSLSSMIQLNIQGTGFAGMLNTNSIDGTQSPILWLDAYDDLWLMAGGNPTSIPKKVRVLSDNGFTVENKAGNTTYFSVTSTYGGVAAASLLDLNGATQSGNDALAVLLDSTHNVRFYSSTKNPLYWFTSSGGGVYGSGASSPPPGWCENYDNSSTSNLCMSVSGASATLQSGGSANPVLYLRSAGDTWIWPNQSTGAAFVYSGAATPFTVGTYGGSALFTVSSAGVLKAGGGSATTIVCWKSDAKTMGYATMTSGNISACN